MVKMRPQFKRIERVAMRGDVIRKPAGLGTQGEKRLLAFHCGFSKPEAVFTCSESLPNFIGIFTGSPLC